ncbi:MAG: PAS domain S-box protein [Gammaproteobacteria bacterium]|nr:PAS domain S-box protein [Gammaproteobacteria bacterium]
MKSHEERLSAIFKTVVDGIITIDDKGIIDSFNPSAEKLFGYQADEVIGHNVKMLMPEQHGSQHNSYINHYIKTKEAKVIGKSRELIGRRKDGAKFPFLLAVNEMSVGGKVMFAGVIHDLSNESFQRQLLNAITEAQTSLSLRSDFKKIFDRLLEQLLKLTESEYGFIGEIHSNESHQAYLKTHAITDISWNEETSEFYQQGAADGLEFTNLKSLFGEVITTKGVVIANDPYNDPRRTGLPEGHPALNAFLGIPFFDGEEIIGMVGIANRQGGYNDELVSKLNPFLITCSNLLVTLNSDKQKQINEASLRESEARGRAILEGAIEAIITIDHKGSIEEVNPATETIFYYSPSELIGKNVKMLMPEPYSSQHDSYLTNYLTTGKAKVIGSGREVIGKRKDGSTFPMELAVNHISVGNRNLFTGVIRDITEQKVNAEQLSALNNDLSLRLAELAEMNQINGLLNEMGTFFQLAETQEELYKILKKYCLKIFNNDVGGYYQLVTKNLLEESIS